MARKVRVFAMILTMPSSKASKAVHVKATWAKRFNDYIFISSEEDKDLPSIREFSLITHILSIMYFLRIHHLQEIL